MYSTASVPALVQSVSSYAVAHVILRRLLCENKREKWEGAQLSHFPLYNTHYSQAVKDQLCHLCL